MFYTQGMDIPRNWPPSFTYCSNSIFRPGQAFVLHYLLATEQTCDAYSGLHRLDTGCIHPDLSLEVIDSVFCAHKPARHKLADLCEKKGHVSRGVFAQERIAPGTLLGEYAGVHYFSHGQNIEENQYHWQVQFQDDIIVCIDGSEQCNELAFVNSYDGLAAKPNAEMTLLPYNGRFRFCYVSKQAIEKGEEVLVTYRVHDLQRQS